MVVVSIEVVEEKKAVAVEQGAKKAVMVMARAMMVKEIQEVVMEEEQKK